MMTTTLLTTTKTLLIDGRFMKWVVDTKARTMTVRSCDNPKVITGKGER
jgi:hypothetical protein